MKTSLIRVLTITLALLCIPLIMMQVDGGGWNWTILDFSVMGGLLFCTGLALEYIYHKLPSSPARTAGLLGVLAAFFVLWAQLAVGAVSQMLQYLSGTL